MPNLVKVLKEEIQRLAKKEAKAAIATLSRDNAALKHAVADHKRRIAKLERDNRRLLSAMQKSRESSIEASDDELQKARITAKMIRGLRGKFGLSQAELALLLGVNSQTVYQWEHKEGRLSFRGDAKAAIIGLRKLRTTEIARRLGALNERG
jgi:DNA-binding transcriptional regulator YiaG